MNQTNIGKFIADCRKEKKLTQAQLADRPNISDRAEENMINLVLDRKQLGYIHLLVSILIGVFIWGLGMVIRVKINKIMYS